MLLDILILVAGLALIIAGGNYLTDGAEAVATRLKMSKAVIGLTVVAFGSSTPDFVISFMSTVQGKTSLALGDIVGANIFDILLVVGVVALVRPIAVGPRMRTREMPMLALAGVALFICGNDRLLDLGTADVVSRTDGFLLLGYFIVLMVITFSMSREEKPVPEGARFTAAIGAGKPGDRQLATIRGRHDHASGQKPPMAWWLATVCVLGGLAALVIGGNLIVKGASAIARAAGMSEALVGLTIVAFGSSVPDLATSLIAAIKNQPGIALGNVVGATAFNVFFIIGSCAAVRPLQGDTLTWVDFGTLALAGLLLWLLSLTRRHTLGRSTGALFILLYAAYMTYLVLSA